MSHDVAAPPAQSDGQNGSCDRVSSESFRHLLETYGTVAGGSSYERMKDSEIVSARVFDMEALGDRPLALDMHGTLDARGLAVAINNLVPTGTNIMRASPKGCLNIGNIRTSEHARTVRLMIGVDHCADGRPICGSRGDRYSSPHDDSFGYSRPALIRNSPLTMPSAVRDYRIPYLTRPPQTWAVQDN